MHATTPTALRSFLRILCRGILATGLAISMTLPEPASASEDLFADLPRIPTPSPSIERAPRYRKALDEEGLYRVTANFESFYGDPLSISFMMAQAASRTSMQEFGISNEEIERMRQVCTRTRQCSQEEFDQRIDRYYRERKLRMRFDSGGRPRLFVDIPAVVRRNREHVRPVANALQQLGGERGSDSQWIFEAAVALVQSGLEYRKPSSQENGRQILGFYTPPRALEQGYGDCDTKSALLASILQNLSGSKIIGVHVPRHYLLGIARAPQPGEAFLEYQGQPYVLLEASGPAARPLGAVSKTTQIALDAGQGIRIDPMF
jgi:hypothetical protein